MAEPKLLKRMKEAGCWQIAYGIESGAQEILNFLKKDITLPQIRETISMTREAGIESRGYFMLGIPRETKETLRETINFLLDLPLDDFHITFFAPHPGSKITANIREYGFFDNDWRKDGGWQVTFIPWGLTREDLEKSHRLAFSKFYFRRRIILAYIKRTFLETPFLQLRCLCVRRSAAASAAGPGPPPGTRRILSSSAQSTRR
jgi:radical SAM superfamily enzyme YgiQ (UPF0313 family)